MRKESFKMGDDNSRTPDFSGWASKYGVVCLDGNTIQHGAFEHQDKKKIPLVWMHNHKDAEQVLGHVIIEHRAQGPYVHGFFNQTTKAKAAKMQLENGDISMLSVWANELDKRGTSNQIFHGDMKEVSLVIGGANNGAEIEQVYIRHSDDSVTEMDEAFIRFPGEFIVHDGTDADEDADADSDSDETVEDRFNRLDPKDQAIIAHMVNESFIAGKEAGKAATDDEDSVEHSSITDADADADSDDTNADSADADADETDTDADATVDAEDTNSDGDTTDDSADADSTSTDESIAHDNIGGSNVTDHNAFEDAANKGGTAVATKPFISHDGMRKIMEDAFEMKDLEGAILKHAGTYGIDNIELLFPEARNLDSSPQLLARQAEWVPKVLDAVKRQPWAKVKSIVADLTADEARAKGYIKGNEKKDEVLQLLQRTTSPTTIYKKQRLDRDDIIDITDFDVIAWIKWEIRFMLNEELARAILIGDGRPATGDTDKIKDPAGQIDGIGIRSILNDHALYVVKKELPANVAPDTIVEEWIRLRSQYRGSGSPTLYTTDAIISDVLLLKDKMGRFLYDTERQLADKLRVKEIVAVEVLEAAPTVLGIVVNLIDYSLGTNKGGELNFFEDFDLDFNQNKYLLETRLSGALTRPKSALVLTRNQGTLATAQAPSFDGATDTITIPVSTGVEYRVDGVEATGDVVIDGPTEVTAHAEPGYYLASNTTTAWVFTV
jgi:HK97 family phage prohead protease